MIEINNFSARISDIEKRFRKLEKMVSRKKINDVDRFFFSFEQLPPRGKEYWFFILTSNRPEKGMQFMATFGNQNVKSYSVDNCRILNGVERDIRIGPFSYWYYDRGIRRSKTMKSLIGIENEKVGVSTVRNEFSFEGKYPHYRLRLTKGGKEICNLKTVRGSDFKGFEVNEFFRGGIGVGYENILVDFSGRINKSNFQGQGYVQKVVITAPLPSVPWYWGRICFSNKSVLNFLQPHISLSKISGRFATSGYFHDGISGRTHFFKKIKVSKYGSKNRQFLVHGASKDSEFTLLAESYAQKTFSLGKLKYEQNLVRTRSFSMEKGGKLVTEKDTGKGIGILEDAYGYVI